jgi:mannosyl-glycoprotein endo-beta-N-acetylglucosaminidase
MEAENSIAPTVPAVTTLISAEFPIHLSQDTVTEFLPHLSSESSTSFCLCLWLYPHLAYDHNYSQRPVHIFTAQFAKSCYLSLTWSNTDFKLHCALSIGQNSAPPAEIKDEKSGKAEFAAISVQSADAVHSNRAYRIVVTLDLALRRLIFTVGGETKFTNLPVEFIETLTLLGHICALKLGWNTAQSTSNCMQFNSFTGFIGNFQLISQLGLSLAPKLPLSTEIRPNFPPDAARSYPPRTYPLYSFAALFSWESGADPHNISTEPLRSRGRNRQESRVIHCHDMRGGYEWDNSQGIQQRCNGYNFRFWALVDIFIYFSHYRVTIPPAQWINCCHRNGALCLGTIITEHAEGVTENSILLSNSALSVQKLVDIAVYYGFDGYLLNFEAAVEPSQLPNLLQFVTNLTNLLRKAINHGKILWYDSVSMETGQVSWQSQLNSHNLAFFQASDGIFLDYHWDFTQFNASLAVAQQFSRSSDLFFGIDCWGRGTLGGGKLNSAKFLGKIIEKGASVAFFGPAWSLESHYSVERAEISRIHYNLLEKSLWLGQKFKIWPISQLLPENNREIRPKRPQNYEIQPELSWEITENSGQGWIVRDFVEKSRNFADFSENLSVLPVFLTSNQWNRRRCALKIEESSGNQSEHSKILVISQDYRGCGPNFADFVYQKLEILAESGEILGSADSGELICAENWQNRTDWVRISPRIAEIVVEQGGKDAENWFGHFGAQLGPIFIAEMEQNGGSQPESSEFQGDRLDSAENQQIYAISDWIEPRLFNFESVLPISCDFNQGYGLFLWENGRKTEKTRWFSLNLQSNQVILQDAVHLGLEKRLNSPENYISMNLFGQNAWQGSDSLQFRCKFVENLQKLPQTQLIFPVLRFSETEGDAKEETQRVSVKVIVKMGEILPELVNFSIIFAFSNGSTQEIIIPRANSNGTVGNSVIMASLGREMNGGWQEFSGIVGKKEGLGVKEVNVGIRIVKLPTESIDESIFLGRISCEAATH